MQTRALLPVTVVPDASMERRVKVLLLTIPWLPTGRVRATTRWTSTWTKWPRGIYPIVELRWTGHRLERLLASIAVAPYQLAVQKEASQ
jgi:hypothetical protein